MHLASGPAFYKFFAFWAAFSSVFILVLIKGGVNSSSVFALKDAPLYFAFIIASCFLIRSKKAALLSIFLCIFLAALFSNYLFLNPEYAAPLANIRQIFAPPVLLLIFISIKLRPDDICEIETVIRNVVFIVFGFGFVEIFFEIWKHSDLSAYFALKGIPVDSFGLSYMFYEPIIGYRERMTSTFLDPISLGHFFATTFSYFFYFEKSKSRRLMLALSSIGLLFTFSKGAYLQAFLAVTLFNNAIHPAFRLICSLAPFFAFFAIPNKTGILIHLNGFSNAIDSLSIFGHGIGSSGNYAKMFADDLSLYFELGISDTFAGALLGQIGLFGFVVWLSAMFSMLLPFARKGNIDAIMLSSLVIVSLVSENTMNVTSMMAPAILIALAFNRKRNHAE